MTDHSIGYSIDVVGLSHHLCLLSITSLVVNWEPSGYFMIAVDDNLEKMPYSTKLYFLKVQEIMSIEMDKSLV